MKHISHYVLWAADNDCYWIPELKDPRYCCPICASKLSRSIENPDFYLKKKNYDISITYDGFLIASDKFVTALKKVFMNNIFECVPIKADKRYRGNYFKVEFRDILEIDQEKAVPEFGSVCSSCGQFEHVVGARGYYLHGAPLGAGIFRTDIEFGSGFEKSPAIVVGVDSVEMLKVAGLKGVSLDPVFVHC